MFKNLRSFWQGRHFLDEVYGEFREMLEGAENMFWMVCHVLLHNANEPGPKQKIHDSDKQINKLQKKLRRRTVEHLALQPTVDASVCLILMSVVKDVLIARHFKRIIAHLVNVATSTMLPLSDIDYFDDRRQSE